LRHLLRLQLQVMGLEEEALAAIDDVNFCAKWVMKMRHEFSSENHKDGEEFLRKLVLEQNIKLTIAGVPYVAKKFALMALAEVATLALLFTPEPCTPPPPPLWPLLLLSQLRLLCSPSCSCSDFNPSAENEAEVEEEVLP